MTPEELAYASEIIREQSLDVDIETISMKKGRLAFRLNILCTVDKKGIVLRSIFKETSTIGIKEEYIRRYSLRREIGERETPNGKVAVKKVYLDGKLLKEKSEYEDRAKIARKKGLSILDIR